MRKIRIGVPTTCRYPKAGHSPAHPQHSPDIARAKQCQTTPFIAAAQNKAKNPRSLTPTAVPLKNKPKLTNQTHPSGRIAKMIHSTMTHKLPTSFRLARKPIAIALSLLLITTAPAAPPASTASLRRSAQVGPAADVFAALKQLAAAGDNEAVRQYAPTLITRDIATLTEEAPGVAASLPRLRANEKEIAALRQSTLSAIAKFVKEPIAQKALKNDYERLTALQNKINIDYARQQRLLDMLDRRAQTLALWHAADPKAASPQPNITAPETDRLTKLVETAIGFSPALAASFATTLNPPADDPKSPENDALRHGLWFYISCRRIEAWNKTLDSNFNLGEITHARKLNAYREALGLLPYEIDLRLSQAARRHSKEMIDLWYFSHWSPTDGLHSSFDRMKAAGYPRPASENIALGGWTGDEAFWFLFNSPDHHRAWIKPSDTALGIGKWENAWGECFGQAPRLMLDTQSQRENAEIKGELLKPQTTELTRKQPRDLRDYKFYDIHGNVFVPEIIKQHPKGSD